MRELFTAGISAVHISSLLGLFARMGVRATMYGSQKSHYPCLKHLEKEERSDIDHVLRNYHRIKTTQPISLILVSFFSEDNVLSDEIIYFQIIMKVTKIERSDLFRDTRYYIGQLPNRKIPRYRTITRAPFYEGSLFYTRFAIDLRYDGYQSIRFIVNLCESGPGIGAQDRWGVVPNSRWRFTCRWELSWWWSSGHWWIILEGTQGTVVLYSGELSLWGIFLEGSCRGGELSGWELSSGELSHT